MDISGIFNQVKSGGFVNPLGPTISSALNSITVPSVADLTTLANAQALAQSVTAPTSGAITAAQTAMVNSYNKMQDLLNHTNKISGVDLSGTGTLATIAKTMQSAKSINGETSCSTVLQAFGSIQNAASLISDTVTAVENIEAFLLDIPNQINAIPGLLGNYVTKVTDQILSDVESLVQAQIAVKQNAIAASLTSLFNDPCTSQILSAVMTQPLKDEVSKFSSAIADAKSISITGLVRQKLIG